MTEPCPYCNGDDGEHVVAEPPVEPRRPLRQGETRTVLARMTFPRPSYWTAP